MKKENKKFNKVLVFTIVVMALFITIISIELITIALGNKLNEQYLNDLKPLKKSYRTYSIDDSKFSKLVVRNKRNIECKDGCNIKIDNHHSTYYYMITHNDDGYRLNIIKNEKVALFDRFIGYDVSNAYFNNYEGNIVFYNIIDDGTYTYDYANIIDEDMNVDEFTSLESEELEFTDKGIIYYYDECKKDNEESSKRIKAIRKPFNISPKVLEITEEDFYWCEK